MAGQTFDVVVIGGGINGAVSAAALAARGLSVALLERNDFASFTSQESSNMVWGGFKYLQNYELALVWELCKSRNELMDAYPTAISEVRFFATLDKTAPFPAWLASLGTFGYWGFGRLATKAPKFFRPKAIKKAVPVVRTDTAKGAIEYSDGYMLENDSRFVWTFVRSALDHGAVALNYAEVVSATYHPERVWEFGVQDSVNEKAFKFKAHSVVNAAGPFVDGLNESWGIKTDHRIVYSKGIHLIVPRVTDQERVLAFFDDTGRLFYVLPMANRSVIGTTDTRTIDANEGVLPEDREFLLDQINRRLDLDKPLTEADIISERCGVRPLVVPVDGDDQTQTDWTKLSRKHEIEADIDRQVVTIFGGKLTDCLNVGDEIAEALESFGVKFGPADPDWFGEPSEEKRDAFYARAAKHGLDRAPTVEHAPTAAEVLWRRHHNAANDVLDLIESDATLAEELFPNSDVLRAELELMISREMLVYADDFLRRRTKLALIVGDEALASAPGMVELNNALGNTALGNTALGNTAPGNTALGNKAPGRG